MGGCASSAVLKAIDDAIYDGVDIISISIGMSSAFQSDFLNDPIAIGAFHANKRGILVVCSGGNDGPDPFTVVNSAPWILTVAASTIDRSFQSSIVLGSGNVLKVNLFCRISTFHFHQSLEQSYVVHETIKNI